MRLGFITAAKPLVDIVDLNTSNTNLQPSWVPLSFTPFFPPSSTDSYLRFSSVSSTTQAIVLVLLNKWGLDGFLAHTRRVAAFYKAKRDMFEKVAHKYLDGLATWVTPDSGMFVSLLFPTFSPFAYADSLVDVTATFA
jgi:tryptophan aminotransferase